MSHTDTQYRFEEISPPLPEHVLLEPKNVLPEHECVHIPHEHVLPEDAHMLCDKNIS